ncbi:MAG TPA: hypothetical protein VGD39_09970 [Nocardioides sp.]
MIVAGASTADLSSTPLRSRSGEGQRAGSSALPGRRSQRASLPGAQATNGRTPTRSTRPRTPGALEPAALADLTEVLQRQRAFRLDQLAGLDDADNTPSDPVRREVDATLRTAARLALMEIEAALRRIELGSFGRCGRCGEIMSVERLTALPMSTWCGSCQHQRELAVAASSPASPNEEPA